MSLQHVIVRLTSLIFALGSISLLAGGCAGRTSAIPNSDKELRKTSVAFAADAAKRTYPATAPRGGDAGAQAAIDHGFFNRIDVTNLSDTDWADVEFWVNQKYVVFIPHWRVREMKHVDFPMLYDNNGGSFPTDNSTIRVEKVEMVRDGKLYTVASKLAD
jgi:hypothetical protein